MKRTQKEIISAGMSEIAKMRWKNTNKADKAAHIAKMNDRRLFRLWLKKMDKSGVIVTEKNAVAMFRKAKRTLKANPTS